MLEYLILMESRVKAKVAGSRQASWSIELHEIDSFFFLFVCFSFSWYFGSTRRVKSKMDPKTKRDAMKNEPCKWSFFRDKVNFIQ